MNFMLSIPKGYFHDKTVLVLVCAQFFIASLGTILILLRLGSSSNYLIQYRSNLGPLSQNAVGTTAGTFVTFILGFLLIAAICIALSMKMYSKQRTYSLLVLSQGVFLLLLASIVSDALLRAS